MSADITKISHKSSFKPLVQFNYTGERSPKPAINQKPSFDPFNDIVESHAKFFNNKKITIYVDEDSIDENECIIVEKKRKQEICNRESRESDASPIKYESIVAKTKNKANKDHIVTFSCTNSNLEFTSNETKWSQTSESTSGDSNESSKSSSIKPSHPSEIWKTILAALLLCLTFFINLIALSIVHDKVPNRSDGPLPDVVLDAISNYSQMLYISEYIIMFSLFSSVTSILLFHRYSSIIFRRTFLILSVLYLYRTVTMSVTVLPTASNKYKCAPKLQHPSYYDIVKRSLSLIPNFGLSVIGPQEFCGDLIYSGHTVLLVLISLVMSEYTTKSLWMVHWLYRCLALIGILMLELSHSHYLIDVIIAYYITTRVFWTYQTLANNEFLKNMDTNNCFTRAWWFHIFLFFEKNIQGPVPNECQWLFDSEDNESDKSNSSRYGSI